jgi:hypothetical protein
MMLSIPLHNRRRRRKQQREVQFSNHIQQRGATATATATVSKWGEMCYIMLMP